MAEKPPYVTAYGNVKKVLEKIQTAATPPRFTQDFLATKLNLIGGSPKPVIPFLKRTGFLGSDGVPTELYKRFERSRLVPFNGVIELLSNNRLRTDKIKLRRFAVQLYFAGEVER